MLLRRLYLLAAALVLACASTQVHAYARALQSVAPAHPALATFAHPCAAESAPRACASLGSSASGQNGDVSPSRIKEKCVAAEKSASVVVTYSYSARDQLEQMTDSVNQLTVAYGYDGNGNRISRTVTKQSPPSTETVTYTFDARDRMIKAQPNAPNDANAPTVNYVYDADGRQVERIETAAGGGTPTATLYVYNGQTLLHEADPSNGAGGLRISDTYRHSALLDRHIAYAQGGAMTLRSYQLDALNTPVAMTDSNGDTVNRTAYDAWGNIEEQTANGVTQAPWQLPAYNPDETGQAALLSNDGQSIGFASYRKDSATGMYYAGARWYDPLIGSFNAMDPWAGDNHAPITFNKQLYANANPLIYIDPTGRIAVLANGANMLAGWNQWLGRRTGEVDKGNVGTGVAIGVGIGRGLLMLTEGGLRGVNAVANIGVVASATVVNATTGTLPRYAEGAAGELMGTQEVTEKTVTYLGDDGAFKSYDAAVARTTQAFEGDHEAISDVGATLTMVAAPYANRGAVSTTFTQNVQQQTRQAYESAKTLAASELQRLKTALGKSGTVAEASKGGGFIGPGIGNTGYKTWEEFNAEAYARYQRYVDDAYDAATEAEADGLLRGNKNTRVGNLVDQQSRARMRAWLESEGIPEGPGEVVQLNRWLRNPDGSGGYVRPDVQLPGLMMDATVGKKPPGTTQLDLNAEYSGGTPTTVVRPAKLGGSCTVLPCPEN